MVAPLKSGDVYAFFARIAATWCAVITTAAAVQIEEFVVDEQKWDMTAKDFAKRFMDQGFEWTTETKETARHPGRYRWLNKKTGKMEVKRPMIGKVPVGETLISFKDGKLSRIDLYAYNRGDDGNAQEHQFKRIVETYSNLLNRLTNVKPEERRQAGTASRSKGLTWTGKTAAYLLEYSAMRATSSSPYRAEFVKLTVAPKKTGLAAIGRETEAGKSVERGELRKNVRKTEEGDVFIPNVPMVDQGAKGYCAVASATRVLQYYGLDVSQHELAQVANATSYGGTNPDQMMDALKKISGKFGVRVNTLDEMDERDLTRIMKDYNRIAEKTGKKTVRIPPRGYYVTVGVLGLMDGEALQAAREKSTNYKRFKDEIIDHIDQGIPLLWSLMLGVYPEKGIPQLAGGHLRLIIGYNEKTDEIIYSDSWGKGHELKRMPTPTAYGATTSLRMIKPGR